MMSQAPAHASNTEASDGRRLPYSTGSIENHPEIQERTIADKGALHFSD